MGLSNFSGVGGAFNVGGNRVNPKPQASSGGAYWRGADGNVWVAGSDGTNKAGRFDNNTSSYWNSKGYKQISDPNAKSAKNNNDDSTNTNSYVTNDSAASGPSASDLQIEQINRLLGTISAQERSGLERLNSSYNSQKSRLGEQKTKTFEGYDKQALQNDQSKQRGVEQVDQFANQSYGNLQRLLQGANAGNSSVGRTLVPQLVSKSAGTRRQGVFDTAGENAQAIEGARGDAEDQYRYSFEDLANQKKQQEEDFRSGVEQQRLDLLAKRLAMESDAGAATDGTRAELDARTATLNSLFGKFAPKFEAKAMNLKTPELGQYQLDPATLRYNQDGPAETRAYLPSLKKKQQLEQGV